MRDLQRPPAGRVIAFAERLCRPDLRVSDLFFMTEQKRARFRDGLHLRESVRAASRF